MSDVITREPRCDVTELIVDQCAHCRRLPDLPAEGAAYVARYQSVCGGCGEVIHRGDRVVADGTGDYVCTGCGHG
jgi:hypothetical protein